MKENHSRYKHGLSYTSVWKRWYNMKYRCYNSTYKGYHNYGGRGIAVHGDWIHNPEIFCDYVMSLPNAMIDGYTLDRIDNNGDYEPGNMRWATMHQQIINRRKIAQDSGYTGVYLRKKTGRYFARIRVDYKYITIGTYDTTIQAAEARDWFIIKNGLWEYPLQIIQSKPSYQNLK